MQAPHSSIKGNMMPQAQLEALVGKKLATPEAASFISFVYDGRIDYLLETASYREAAKELKITFIDHIHDLLSNNVIKPSEVLYMCLLEEDLKALYIKLHDDAERFTGIYQSIIERLCGVASSFKSLEFLWQHLNTSHSQSEKFADIILSNGMYLICDDRHLDFLDTIARFSGGPAMVKLVRLTIEREVNKHMTSEN